MKKRVWTLGIGLLAASYAACLPPSGDALVDRNRDGILDTETGSVRGIDTVTQAAPTSPTCVVFGTLLHGYTGAPLADQRIEIVTGKNQHFSASTDSEGGFLVTGVSIGQFRLNIKADGLVPFNEVLTCDKSAGNVDNNSVFLGRISMLPADSTASFTVYTVDGDPVPNQVVYVDTPTALRDTRTTIDGAGAQVAYGLRTTVVTTNADGLATLPGVPDPTKLYNFDCTRGGGSMMYRVTGPSIDINADGVWDYCGTIEEITSCDAAKWGNKFRLTPLTRTGRADIDIVASNATHRERTTWNATPVAPTINTQPSLVAVNESVTFVFNRPVDLATADIAIINDFSNNRDGHRLDNSTPFRPGQSFPIDAFTAIAKPASGMGTLILAQDPSRTIVTMTPSTGFAPGRTYYITGSIAAAEVSTGGSNPLGQTTDIFQFVQGDVGIFVAPGGPLAVEGVYLQSSNANGTGGFNDIVVAFNQPVRGYNAAAGETHTAAAAAYVLVCFDEELQGNGFAGNPEGALDHFECPQAGHQVVTVRDIDDGSALNSELKGLMRARIRQVSDNSGTGIAHLRPGFSRFYQIESFGPLIGRNGGKLKVFFPVANGAPYIDVNQATTVDGSAVAAGTVLDATFTIAPVSSNAKLDFSTNPTPSLQ